MSKVWVRVSCGATVRQVSDLVFMNDSPPIDQRQANQIKQYLSLSVAKFDDPGGVFPVSVKKKWISLNLSRAVCCQVVPSARNRDLTRFTIEDDVALLMEVVAFDNTFARPFSHNCWTTIHQIIIKASLQ